MKANADAGEWISAVVGQVTLLNRPKNQRDQNCLHVAEQIFLKKGQLAHEFADVKSLSDNDKRVQGFGQLLRRLAADSEASFQQLFWLFTYQPEDVFEYFGIPDKDTYTWVTIVELYEAFWQMIRDDTPLQLSARGRRTAAAYIARTRWILYSLAYHQPKILLSVEQDRIQENRLGQLAREAREDWVTVLDAIEDHPLLARDIDAAADVAALTKIRLDQTKLQPGRPTPRDAEVWRHCVRHHLLSRFLLSPAWRVAWALSGWRARVALIIAALALGAGVVLLAVSVIWPSRSAYFTWGTAVATVGYLAIAAAAAGERSASWPWLLRQPASAAVGLLALSTMNPHWWEYGSKNPVAASIAAAGLAAAAMVYLAVEAINHGVSGARPLMVRVGSVIALGVAHAVLVAGLALRAVVPVYAENGEQLRCLWTGAECAQGGEPILILMLAAGWAFAAGVFIQILWEDQPSTAPLAHLGWRGRK